MIRIHILILSAVLASFFSVSRNGSAQDRAMSSAPAFSGGVFVTPVRNAPFSAEVVQEMRQVLKDGSSFQRKTAGLIARDSQGRIRNESHEVLPASSTKKPVIYSVHLYDPESRQDTILNPNTHIARQRVLSNPPSTEPPSNWWVREPDARTSNPNLKVPDLGSSVMDWIEVQGFRRIVTIPDNLSGTGRPVVVTDEIWYSEKVHINILTRHNDPRTGELTMTVTQINLAEPDVDLFAIPPDYKLVDMTPPDQDSQKPVRVEQ